MYGTTVDLICWFLQTKHSKIITGPMASFQAIELKGSNNLAISEEDTWTGKQSLHILTTTA